MTAQKAELIRKDIPSSAETHIPEQRARSAQMNGSADAGQVADPDAGREGGKKSLAMADIVASLFFVFASVAPKRLNFVEDATQSGGAGNEQKQHAQFNVNERE